MKRQMVLVLFRLSNRCRLNQFTNLLVCSQIWFTNGNRLRIEKQTSHEETRTKDFARGNRTFSGDVNYMPATASFTLAATSSGSHWLHMSS